MCWSVFYMKIIRCGLLLLVGCLGAASLSAQSFDFGQETSFDRQLNTRDDQALREFTESKESMDVKEKAKNLELSGEVHFEWRSIQEKGMAFYFDEYSDNEHSSSIYEDYRHLRGGHHVDAKGLPISTNDFDVEFDFKAKYTYKDAWAFAHLQFDTPAGISGRADSPWFYPVFNKNGTRVLNDNKGVKNSRWDMFGSGNASGIYLSLKRCYIGYKLYADDINRLDVELGRRKFNDIFISEIEFTSRFDGLMVRFARSDEDALMDWYVTGGAFVIDERVNHFGYAVELGLLDIYDTGLDLRYNFIDWIKRGRNRYFVMNPWGMQFQDSQWSYSYNVSYNLCEKEIPVEYYGGFLINHAAKARKLTHWNKKNLGWYMGILTGKNRKKGDWSLDLEYIAVQAQAVPEYDVGSIGRGNTLDENFDDRLVGDFSDDYYGEDYPYYSYYPYSSSSSSSSGMIGFMPARGNGNFVGGRSEFLYNITDNLTIDVIFEMSVAEDDRIGGPHHYQDFELEAIYAW